MADPLVGLGRIGRAHGVRGEMQLVPYHAESRLLDRSETLIVGGERRVVRSARRAGDRMLLALEGVTTREAAEALRGAEVALTRAELPPADDGEVYLADLVGCECVEGDQRVGVVTGVATYPASVCLVVDEGASSIEVPTAAPYLVSIDLDARRVAIAHTADLRPEPRKPRA